MTGVWVIDPEGHIFDLPEAKACDLAEINPDIIFFFATLEMTAV